MIEMWWKEIIFPRPQACGQIGASVIPGNCWLPAFAHVVGRRLGAVGAFYSGQVIWSLLDIRFVVPSAFELPHGFRDLRAT